MAEFLMPKLGDDMTAGTLIDWQIKPGDVVRRGDVVAEVETDKGVIEVEIFTGGAVERLLVQPGEKVPVGTVLATVREAGPVPAEASVPARASSPAAGDATARPQPPPAPTPALAPDLSRLRISPSARDLARKLGVDPASIQGTGPRGAITREDIEKEAAAKPAPAPPSAAERTARMRQAIAAAMTRSKREVPHYYLNTTIDMHRALTWLAEENAKRPVADRLLPGVLLLRPVAVALREVPELNAVWANGQVVTSPAIHVGVAISLRKGGLVAPAPHDTDKLSLGKLMELLRDLVNRARTGALRSSEFSDPTITVTSLGDKGVETTFGIIYPPQVAIVGFGKIVERPWVVDGQVAPPSVVTATLSADHRVSDGHPGGLFLAALDRLLQEPSKL